MRYSVIIPTYNEEKYLPILLENIPKDIEIIIADNFSTDKTREIAKNYQCNIINGGLPGEARNRGARVSSSSWIIFFDADVKIDKDFFTKLDTELKKNTCIGATTLVRPLSNNLFDKLYFMFSNVCIYLFQYFKPLAHGFIIIVNKKKFLSINGFDESLNMGEDFDLSSRLSKLGKFKVLRNISVYVSMRRFDKEGRLTLLWKYTLSTLNFFFRKKKLKKTVYKWGDYQN